MRWGELGREPCSMARTISVSGERWTLTILRDCFPRIRRFEDFERSLGITRHLLADRLRKLVKSGVLRKVVHSERPKRHEHRLTEKGVDLYPFMMSISHRARRTWSAPKGRPLLHEHVARGHTFDPVTTCSHCREEISARAAGIGARKATDLGSVPNWGFH